MSAVGITVEGGIFPADLFQTIQAAPEEVQGQRAADFGLDGVRMSEEIQDAFSIVRTQWQRFARRREAVGDVASSVTRADWVLPFLEVLGWTLTYQRSALQRGGTGFLISHLGGDGDGAPPVHIVAFDRALDERGKDRERSPHALLQEFLNRDDALWGIVTNGRKLRLLRNTERFTKPSYVEFDLEAIVEDNLYSEFLLLYRVLHRTRFPEGAGGAHECLLERWYQQGIEEGGRVRERLRDGVEAALKAFGTGFLAHPESEELRDAVEREKLPALDLYRELLRLVYRLLFLMVAEERKLLFLDDPGRRERQEVYTRWYSIERLRARAEARRGDDPHPDLWQGLIQTFRLFREERHAKELGLGVLDGELFGGPACRFLERAQIRNDALLEAIFHLSWFKESEGRRRDGQWRRVAFSHLDVEELGSVYESLLDFRPDVSLAPARFDLLQGTERDETGSYYTPKELVAELIKSALEPVMEERLAAAKAPEDKERALLDLRVCDPAAGSGHFLLAAARRLGRELARVRTGEAEPPPSHYRRAIRDVVRHCLYAVDKNPLAVDLCKVSLWIEGHDPGLPLSFLDHHIRLGDSLVGVFDTKVLEKGVPDAAYKALTGDDKDVARELRRRNQKERDGQQSLDLFDGPDLVAAGRTLARAFEKLDAFEDDSPAAVAEKERRYHEYREMLPEFRRLRQAADLWTAAFFTPLRKPKPGEPERVPTTDHVIRALGGRPGIQGVMPTTIELRDANAFFHWPLEFPEVMAKAGFDVMLGNPPWGRIKLQEQKFFATRRRDIADATNASARGRMIEALKSAPEGSEDRKLHDEFEDAKRATEAASEFVRASGRFPLTAVGDVNTYALFAELFLRTINRTGRSGTVLPTGIANSDQTKLFFNEIATSRRLIGLYSFFEIRKVFLATDDRNPFCLVTLGATSEPAQFAFSLLTTAAISDAHRRFTLSAEDIALLNPNTRTCPVFRTGYDAELTKKIYRRVPVLIDDSKGEDGNPWDAHIRQGLFHLSNDIRDGSVVDVLATTSQDGFEVPLYEAKLVDQFNHRLATYGPAGEAADLDLVADPEACPSFRYFTDDKKLTARVPPAYAMAWFIVFRDVARSADNRTLIACAVPRIGVAYTLRVFDRIRVDHARSACLLANLNCLVADYIARQKIGGTHVTNYLVEQLPLLSCSAYGPADLDFIVPRVLELTYTARDMQPFARDLGYDGPPFRWDPERRAMLRAELDAYYAYLYGLTREELCYILDPKAVKGEDFPSETFRVLKNNEIRQFGEYRTQRLVLEAFDRFASDGTFDPARLQDPIYFPVLQKAYAEKSRAYAELEAPHRDLLARADQQPKPTLFVEGRSDVPVIEAAWSVFFPDEPMPFAVLAAGGTTQMGSLAGKGKALRDVLGDRLVCALADNDGEGRELWDNGLFRKGGVWRLHPNGIWWCLLQPRADFRAVMERFEVPEKAFPYTLEAAFPAAIRRQAMAEGAYILSDEPQTDLSMEPAPVKKLFAELPKLDPDDDARLELLAPHHSCKEPFAAWITEPERRAPGIYAAFEPVMRGLKELTDKHSKGELGQPQRPAAE